MKRSFEVWILPDEAAGDWEWQEEYRNRASALREAVRLNRAGVIAIIREVWLGVTFNDEEEN